MNKDNLPVLYSLVFAREFDGLPQGPVQNLFQIKIHHAFAGFLKDNIDVVLEISQVDTGVKKELRELLVANTSFGSFSSFSATQNNEKTIYINFVVPVYSERVPLHEYLHPEAIQIGNLFSLLELAGVLFMQTEHGKEYRRVTFADQPFIPSFIPTVGGHHLSFEIQGDLVRELNRLLYAITDAHKEELKLSINSILAHQPQFHDRTYVVLRHGYVQVEIYGDGCALIRIDSTVEEKFTLTGRNIDTPVQLIALFAAIGTLFALAKN
jgi:hypothetical protein